MGPPATSPVIQKPPFICGATQEYTFCAPIASGDSYLAVHPNIPPQQDVKRIQSWFMNPYVTPIPSPETPDGMRVPAGARIYKVTNLLPRILTTKNGNLENTPGPNCYQTALAALGYSDVLGRYVDGDEFRYYLKRDFRYLGSCERATFGSIVVYGTEDPSEFDSGIHAAFHLLGALVFQKGGPDLYYPYEIAQRDRAMNVADTHWRPSREDRYNPNKPKLNQIYKFRCYQKNPNSVKRKTSSEKMDRSWYMPLFRYYIRRLENASKVKWSEFHEKRMDHLTFQNLRNLLIEFGRERVTNLNPLDVLLKFDDDIAMTYLKLYSLRWQYDKMCDVYDPVRDGWSTRYWEDIYKNHYVTYDDNFREEVKLYLKLMAVPESKWNVVIEYAVKKMKTYDISQYIPSWGGSGIPFIEVLKEAIQANK